MPGAASPSTVARISGSLGPVDHDRGEDAQVRLVPDDRDVPRLRLKEIVPKKFRRLQLEVPFGHRDNLLLLRLPRPIPLLLHVPFEAFDIDGKASFASH